MGGKFLSPAGWSFYATISDPGETPKPHDGDTIVEDPIAHSYRILDHAELNAKAGKDILEGAGRVMVECDFGPYGGLYLSHELPQMVPDDVGRAEVEAVLLRIRENLPR